MGDRCELLIAYRIKDEMKFEEVLGKDWFSLIWDEGDCWRTVHVEQVNYGMIGPREQLNELWLSFVGEHGAGSEYGPYVFAAFNGEMADVHGFQGQPLVPVNDDGEVKLGSLKEARRYLELYKKAAEFIGVNSKETKEDTS